MHRSRFVASSLSLTLTLLLSLSACSKDSKNERAGATATEAPAPAPPPLAQLPDEGAPPTAEQFAIIINSAGRLRMLTQKMAKEVALVAAAIDAEDNKKNAVDTLAQFKKTHAGLRHGDESLRLPKGHFGKVNARLDDLGVAFKSFEQLVTKGAREPLAKPELAQLAELADALIEKEEPIVSILSGQAGTLGGTNVAIDVAGRQRMFTQKMTKDAIFVFLKVDPEKHRLELQKTGSLFDKVQRGFKNGDKDIPLVAASDPRVIAQVDAVAALWKPFYEVAKKHAQSKVDMTKEEAETVAKLNLPLLKEANKVVELYEQSKPAVETTAAVAK